MLRTHSARLRPQSPKKFDAPMSAPDAVTACSPLKTSWKAIGEAGVKVNLQRDWHRDQNHVEEAPRDVVRLEGEYQHQRCPHGDRHGRVFYERTPREQRIVVTGGPAGSAGKSAIRNGNAARVETFR